MIKEKEVIGVKTNEYDGKIFTELHYCQSFDNPKGTLGKETGIIKTTKTVNLVVGDIFKAYYDVGEFWDNDLKKRVQKPVLVELVKVNK